MVHNQISYTVGPDYFHKLKFLQFDIPDAYQNRLGAAFVGWQASWWMGLVIGIPIALLSLAIPSARRAWRAFVWSAFIVVVLTLVLGIASLFLNPPMERIPMPRTVLDPIGYGRAAMMHSASYLAGLIGLVLGLIFMGVSIRNARRRS